ncbi:MAG TPA: mechanosensitive ion channel [Armatimonadota bacterium]|nr:mechanosensitive ion channel [Armatimonadota bacterium]HQK93620.1 mechanosensitive ion channel [Armatimonadota bacterium]
MGELSRLSGLEVARVRTELTQASQRIAELQAGQQSLHQSRRQFPRAVLSGMCSPAEANREIQRLVGEEARYARLYDEFSSARDQALIQGRTFATQLQQARALVGNSAHQGLALRQLGQRAQLANELGIRWSEAAVLTIQNAELAATAASELQRVVASAAQRHWGYREPIYVKPGTVSTGLADLLAVVSVALPVESSFASDLPQRAGLQVARGWLLDLLALAVTAGAGWGVLSLLSRVYRKRRQAPLGPWARLALIGARTALCLLAVWALIPALGERDDPVQLAQLHRFYGLLAALGLATATLPALGRSISGLPAFSGADGAELRPAWCRAQQRLSTLALCSAIFVPGLISLREIGYPHEDVRGLLEGLFGVALAYGFSRLLAPGGLMAVLGLAPASSWAKKLALQSASLRQAVLLVSLVLLGLHGLGWTNLARTLAWGLSVSLLMVLGLGVAIAVGPREVSGGWGRLTPWLLYALALAGAAWGWGLRGYHVGQFAGLLTATRFSFKNTQVSGASLLQGIALAVALALLGRWLRRWIQCSTLTQRWDQGARYAVATTTYYICVTGGILAGVLAAGFQLSVLTVFAGMAGVAIGFGSQDIAKNFIGGVIILLDRSVNVGDYVIIGAAEGTITDINIRCTTLRTPDGKVVIVPNANLIAQQMVNATQGHGGRIRLTVDVTVAMDSDPDKVMAILTEVARQHPRVATEPAPRALVSRLSAAALNIQLIVWTAHPEDQTELAGELTTRIFRALREQKIVLA